MKNKNLITFIVIGFILTTAIWGFVGGCGTSRMSWETGTGMKTEEEIREPAEVKGQTYIVEPGDTLWGLSMEFGVSVAAIKEINKLEKDTISVGQKLVIPGLAKPEKVIEARPQLSPAVPKPGLIVYKVRKDDSLWRIAQIYGTTVEHIADINGLPKNARLTPGQEILVPSDE